MSTANPTTSNTAIRSSITEPNQQVSHLLPLAPSITLSETFDEEDLSSKTSSMSLLHHLHHHNYQSNLPAPQALPTHNCLAQQKHHQSIRSQSQPLPLLSLPIDVLHKVSTFLEVRDWCSVSLVDRAAHIICSDVFRRVRMHGFKCAAEIITSWEAGEHEDAKELVALYLHSGIPIYPAHRRDVYHTLLQRMKVETTEMIQPTETNPEDDENNNNNNNTMPGSLNNVISTSTNGADTPENQTQQDDNPEGDSTKTNDNKRTVDRFYLERKDARGNGGYYLSTLTYLEEKSLFWRDDSRPDRGTGVGGGAVRGFNQLRNNPRHGVPHHTLRNGAAREENLHHHLRQYYPVEDFGLFHDYNLHQLRTFRDPDVSVVAAFDAVTPFRDQPLPPGGIDVQGRYYRNPNVNQHERNARMAPDDALRLPLPRSGMDVSNINPLSSPLMSLASSETETNRRRNKMVLHCHKHLVDRHYLGRPAVLDDDGVMVAAPINLGADFFHPGAGGVRTSDGAMFGFSGLPRRDGYGLRMNMANTGGTNDTATARMARHDPWTQEQTQIPNRIPIHTAAARMLYDEEEEQAEPSPHNTEHSGETLYLTPSSSPTSTAERNGSITPPPPPESIANYPTSATAASTTGLTPPTLLHSNLTPPLLGTSLPYPDIQRSPTAMQHAIPPPYDDMEVMGNERAGGFSRATFPFVVELNVMNDVALHSYSSTFGPYQVYDEKQQHHEEPQQHHQQMHDMKKRQSGGSLAWRKKVRDLIRHYEVKLKSHLDKSFKRPLSDNINGNINSGSRNKITCYADHASFNETLLDFWDEFFSLTANIHYFDTSSPIPRATRMWEFLSQPCSKALGTIQCEIQRTRTVKNPNGKKKRRGAGGVKERLFPTYEYRLFLRDRRCVHRQQQNGQGEVEGQDGRHHQYQPQPLPQEVGVGGEGGDVNENGDLDQQPPTVRLDTILMAAKYRGKKHGSPVNSSGGQFSSSQSKKGVNNYYLHMPQKPDIEQHFKTVNPSIALQEYEHLVQKAPPSTGKELGRVQSNFIGTEFQIFSPKNVSRCSRCCNKGNNSSIGAIHSSCAVCEGTSEPDLGTNAPLGGFNRHLSDSTTPRSSSETGAQQKKGLRRLRKSKSRRKRNSGNVNQCDSLEEDGESNQAQQGTENGESQTAPPPVRSFSRLKSSWLRSRRVIANSTTELSDSGTTQSVASHEVEIGAITYTANLLGNRPRIMDVCIPNVHSNEWKNYSENYDSARWGTMGSGGTIEEERSMLNKLKLLQLVAEQQLMQNHIGGMLDAHVGNPAETNDSAPDFGLLSLQNRPPWWNVELGAFVLNFGGRVSVASVKNFQLCDRHNHDDSMLQFGRIEGRHSFTMDYSYPLSAVQAFAIAISSLQSKISFG